MKVSPHCHPESPLTGSTLASMVKKAKELGRTHFCYTDHGHLSSALKAYKLAKAEGLKFIPGIEIYFKDSSCPIVSGTKADRCKYFTLSLYCHDQEAYQELSKKISSQDFPKMTIKGEQQGLWKWSDLEELSRFNVSVVLGGIHCLVGKTMLAGSADLSLKILNKLISLFKDRINLSILCEPWQKKFSQVVELSLEGNKKLSLMGNDLVTTDRARRIRAIDLTERTGHSIIKSVSSGSISNEINAGLKSAKLHKGFLPLPGGDVSLKINKFFIAISTRYKLPLLATDYAYFANKEDKVVQTMRLEGRDKLHPTFHMKSEDEIVSYLSHTMRLSNEEIKQILNNNEKFAQKFDNLSLSYEWKLAEVSGDPIKIVMDIINKNGRMKWDNPAYVNRLKEEFQVIIKNPKKDLLPYFLPIREVLNFYKENGYLTGPGRGSAGGSLLCYLMGITQIDPIQFDLPFHRFFSLDRIMSEELPDIDVDLEDRTPLVGEDGKSGFLYKKWGNKAAQISTRATIRLKTAIKDTNRYFNGKVEEIIENLTKALPPPPQGISDADFVFGFEDQEGNHIDGLIEQSEDLKKYIESRPNEWNIVSKAMGITRAYSAHASAFVLSDEPIKNLVPVRDGHITQYEAKECESAGLIKYDFLVVNQLKDIRVCLDLINKKNNESHEVGYFTHEGRLAYVWDLPQDPNVFKSVWGGSTETCFQINTRSMVPFVKDILPQSMQDLSAILALVRPGPLDFIDPNTGRNMAEEYVLRRKGLSRSDIPILEELLPETFGVITYQEQLYKIARDLASFSGPEAELLRAAMAKKKMVKLMEMKPDFIEGAKKKVDEETAEAIWDQMVTFGRYGFSIIHALEYSHITYTCMFLKYHYPLEWWAAILTNAPEQEITGKLWPYVRDFIMPPDINLSDDTMVVDYANEKIRSKLSVVRGMGNSTMQPIIENRPYKDIQDFVNKKVAGDSLAHKLIHVGILDSLFPPKLSLAEKLKMYEDAVEIKKFNEKKEKAEKEGKKMRALQPKEGSVPEKYLNLHPLKDAAMKKAVLPSIHLSTYDLGKNHSKALVPYFDRPKVMAATGHETFLVSGDILARFDEQSGDEVKADQYFAATGFIVKTEEFTYAKGSKKALKIIFDCDGYVSEKVLWPDYDSGQLIYPPSLKKGVIATIFFRKRKEKKDLQIRQILVESEIDD